ncbi:MAG: hypothetical protein M0R74_04190 [Dehalococcoidia bacterium]|nr:hypothetical protein [Dehalococcoidia bacterium]
MSVGVSIPEDLYNELDAAARQQDRPASELAAEAIRRFLAGSEQDDAKLTAELDSAYAELYAEEDAAEQRRWLQGAKDAYRRTLKPEQR